MMKKIPVEECSEEIIHDLAKKYVLNTLPQDEPIFIIICGAAKLTDREKVRNIVPKDVLFVDILEAFNLITNKDEIDFTSKDIPLSSYLASTILIEAHYKSCSIAVDVGVIEKPEDIEDIARIMQILGYQAQVKTIDKVVSNDTNADENILSENEQYIVDVKKHENRNLIHYLFEDITSTSYSDLSSEALAMVKGSGFID
ncbi:MAG: hypothetical protein KGV50_05255 [Gammaproteobacteria bacterium]|nr:hypothetical protein [Gammaproteobacteria bacterium]